MSFWEQVLFSVEILSPTALAARGVAMYLILLFFARLMGQRELGTMSSFDVIVAITIGNIAAAPMFNSEDSVIRPALAIATLALLHVATSLVSRRWENWRRLIAGDPIVLVQEGKLLEQNLAAARMSVDELLQELRLKGVAHLADVQHAVLEPKGAVSIVREPDRQPLTWRQLRSGPAGTGLPQLIIVDGRIIGENLAKVGKDETWLRRALAERGIRDLSEIAVGQVDDAGRLYLDRYDDSGGPDRMRARAPGGPGHPPEVGPGGADRWADDDLPGRLATTRLGQAAASLEALAHSLEDPEAGRAAAEAAAEIRRVADRVLGRTGTPGRPRG